LYGESVLRKASTVTGQQKMTSKN